MNRTRWILVTVVALIATAAFGATTGADSRTPARPAPHAAGVVAEVMSGDNFNGVVLADAVADASSTLSGAQALVGVLDDPDPSWLQGARFPDGSPDDHALMFMTGEGNAVLITGDEVFEVQASAAMASIDPHWMLDVLGITSDWSSPIHDAVVSLVLDVEADCGGAARSVLCLTFQSSQGALYAINEIKMAGGGIGDFRAALEIKMAGGGIGDFRAYSFGGGVGQGTGNDLAADPDAGTWYFAWPTEEIPSQVTSNPITHEELPAQVTADPATGPATGLAGNDNEWRALPSPGLVRDLVDLLWFTDQTDPLTELRAMMGDALGWFVPDLDSDSSGMIRADLAGAVVEVLRQDPALLDLAIDLGRARLDGRLGMVIDYPDFLDIQLLPGAPDALVDALAGPDGAQLLDVVRALQIVSDTHELALVLSDWLQAPGREFKVEIEGVTQGAFSWAAAPLVHPRFFDEADAIFGKRTELRQRDLAEQVEQMLVRIGDQGLSDDVAGVLADRLGIAIDHVGAGLRPEPSTRPIDQSDPTSSGDDAERTATTEAGGTDETDRTTTVPSRSTDSTVAERPTTTTADRPTTTTADSRPSDTTDPPRPTTTAATDRPTTTTDPARPTTTTEPARPTTTSAPDRPTTTTAPDRTTTTAPDRTTTTTTR